ncbi:hypothetical protein ACWN8V_01330 [Vagococcus elongatus]|nr:hypothetical protein [Vagococcus elongatus]
MNNDILERACTFRCVGGSNYDVILGNYYLLEFFNHKIKKDGTRKRR